MEKMIETGMSFLQGVAMVPALYTALAMVGGLLVLGYLYEPYWKVRRVPGPPLLPLLGHLHLMAKHRHEVFSILAKTYGPIFRFHVGRQPMVIVADADLCREVGIKKFKEISARSIPSAIAASPLHTKGLFFTSGSRWSAMRNAILSVYQPSYLANLVPTMQGAIDQAFQNLPSSKDEDITFSELTLKLSTDIIGQTAFGVDFGLSKPPSSNEVRNSDEVSEFIDEHMYSTTNLKQDLSASFSIIMGLIFPILQRPVLSILTRIPGTVDWKIEETSKKMSKRLDEIVEKRMNAKDRGNKDYLSLILNARDSERATKNIFTMEYLSASTYEHLLAGSTTISFTLASTVYLVSDHPQVEKKLLQEIDGFGPPDKKPTADDLQDKFPYLDQVVKEAMRYFTLTPIVGRETCTQVELGGYVLPKGTWVWIAPGILSKDPKHFPEPEKFKPERFDPNCDEEKHRHPYAYIPFGIGPRACLGQKYSLQEIKLALVHLYQNYVFRHSPNMEKPLAIDYSLLLSFRHGVKLRVIKRRP